ncbi:TIGR03826 family flagellar region protein [Oceanobacillus polygoni]|uniref:Flagellar operon protein (TIGR03826 family) n=1 Tax=Oceanobacillus polygoni TaxID=1235259 RepID=A0A9X0YX11_9BACI|nr:TIGR03826 family flagellar region protein [Oceanobacillus polygoni]MBP2078905.1 flagellar operon protein (TIGR03826 family) [Oceanobacillus polygoni]
MAELANCVRCNAVFVKGLRDVCQNCYKKEEDAFQTVYRYLRERKNREATLLEIIDATGVEESLIIKFIKEKRLLPSDFPKLAYPCERCGNEITSGKLCISCSEELKSDLNAYEKTEQIMEEARKLAAPNIDTYYAIAKHKK